MSFLPPIPDLGACEGRWITVFGTQRLCSYRASASFDAPCGHVHRFCATCVYALERGIGSWDLATDVLYFGEGSGPTETAPVGTQDPALSPAANPVGFGRRKPRSGSRHLARFPVHVVLAGVAAAGALLIALMPTAIVAAPTALATAVLAYAMLSRQALLR